MLCKNSSHVNYASNGSSLRKIVKDEIFLGDDCSKFMGHDCNTVSVSKPMPIVVEEVSGENVKESKMFMENSRKDGNLFVLEVGKNDGVLGDECFKFMDHCCDVSVPEGPEPVGVETGSRGNVDSENVDTDPHLKMFIENFRENGNSFVVDKSNGVLDKDCSKFMDHSCDVGVLKTVGVEIGSGGNIDNKDEDEDADPHFKMFMQNLRGDGNSFALKADKNDGSSEFLKYDRVFDSHEEYDMEYPRKSKGDIKREKIKRRKYLSGVQMRKSASNVKNFSRKVGRDNVVSGRDNEVNLREERRNSVILRGDNVENLKLFSAKERRNLIVQWKELMENSGKERKIVAQKMDNVDNLKKYPRKERRNSVVLRGDTMENPVIISCKEKMNVRVQRKDIVNSSPAKKRRIVAQKRDNVDSSSKNPRKGRTNSEVLRGDNMENPIIISDKEKGKAMVQKKAIVKNSLPGKKRRMVAQRRENVDNHNTKLQKKCAQKYGQHESCFELFLRSIEVKEDSLSVVDNGKRFKYEDDSEHSSDLEILEMNNALDHKEGKFSPFVLTKGFNTTVVEEDDLQGENDNPQFREKLMGILRRPYNQEEYENLLQKAKRRHINRGPEYSEGKRKTAPTETYGKSPLDYHTDVKRKICAARYNRPQKLNILRGFMYWYEKACQDGAFKPWLDKLCLAVTLSPQ